MSRNHVDRLFFKGALFTYFVHWGFDKWEICLDKLSVSGDLTAGDVNKWPIGIDDLSIGNGDFPLNYHSYS